MSGPQDRLIRLRQMSFDRTAADTSRAASELKKAQELLDKKKDSARSLESRRNSLSSGLQDLHDARWLAHLWAFDRLLAEDLEQAREEVDLGESRLAGRLQNFYAQRRKLAAAQARLLAAQNLKKRRRRTIRRRRERRMEEEVSGIQTPCLE
jgi:hypothetical protein